MSVDFQILPTAGQNVQNLLSAQNFLSDMFRPRPPVRRRLLRIGLTERITARFGTETALLIDISLSGILLAHETPQPKGALVRLMFHWRGATIDAEVEIMRSEMHRPLGVAHPLQRSGVAFRRFFGSSETILRNMMTEMVERALDERRSNANGVPPQAASTRLPGKMRGYQRNRFVQGSWQRTETVDAMQPSDGFTVSIEDDPAQIALLRQTYEKLSEQDRDLVRKLSAMSISNPTGIPTRRYEP